MTEAIDGNHRETNLAGKLDALARRGGAAHPGQVHGGAAQRSRITFEYAVSRVRICQAVFMYLHSCSRYVLKKVLSHLESVALSPLIIAARVLSHGMHLVQRRQVARFKSSRITLTKMGCLYQLHLEAIMQLLLFTSLVLQLSEWHFPCTRQQVESCILPLLNVYG